MRGHFEPVVDLDALVSDPVVIPLLAHSLEMLLKASVLPRRRTVRGAGDNLSDSLLRCVDLSGSRPGSEKQRLGRDLARFSASTKAQPVR